MNSRVLWTFILHCRDKFPGLTTFILHWYHITGTSTLQYCFKFPGLSNIYIIDINFWVIKTFVIYYRYKFPGPVPLQRWQLLPRRRRGQSTLRTSNQLKVVCSRSPWQPTASRQHSRNSLLLASRVKKKENKKKDLNFSLFEYNNTGRENLIILKIDYFLSLHFFTLLKV